MMPIVLLVVAGSRKILAYNFDLAVDAALNSTGGRAIGNTYVRFAPNFEDHQFKTFLPKCANRGP
jgi:hypothetical protein